jgi:hypothetical protein
MLKHVGRHGDRKVAIVFREIPGDEHMCLVVYPDTLPSHIDSSIMKVVESPAGQQENTLAEALHRNLLPDGRPILEALHREGMLKKVPSNQVIVTPTPSSSVKLDELNRLVKEMEQGEDAARRMAELDASTGLVDPAVKRKAEQEFKRQRLEQEAANRAQNIPATDSNALDDRALAANMLGQALRMETEAKGLVAEAARMKKEAERMFPGVSKADAAQIPAPVAKTRGRKKAVDAVQ